MTDTLNTQGPVLLSRVIKFSIIFKVMSLSSYNLVYVPEHDDRRTGTSVEHRFVSGLL